MARSILGLVALALMLPGVAEAQPLRGSDGMRDRRYCEVLVVNRSGLRLAARVYNTIGLNDCPDAAWRAVDPERLKRRFDAAAIVMNGPRHFVMDRIESADVAADVTDMDGLAMRQLATLELPLSTARQERQSYEVQRIARTTRYVYAAGQPVFELVDPAGRVFVMQAYAQIVDAGLTYAALPGLGARLRLPTGWQYRARTPEAPFELSSTGEAEVVQDELQNTYQLVR